MAKLIDLIVSGKSSFASDINAKTIYSTRLYMSGAISTCNTAGSWVSGMTNAAIRYNDNAAISTSSYHPFLSMKAAGGHVVNFGGLNNTIGFYGYYNGRTANSYDWSFTVDSSTGKWTMNSSIKASAFITNGGANTQVVRGDGTLQAISELSVSHANTSTSTTKVNVNQHTGNDTEYPVVWSNQANTTSAQENQLYKSYSDLTYNPKNKRITAGQFVANNGAGPHFTGTSTAGNWAYLRLNNSSAIWDIATKTTSGSGGLWLSRYGGNDNGIFVSAAATPKVGINTSSPSYALHVTSDAYATGWVRAGNGFYVEGKGVHYMSNNANGLGQIYLTSNEFNWSASGATLYFNYRASANGTTVTSYVWNAGSSNTYANHTTGKIDAKNHVLTTNNFGINSTAGGGKGISLYGGSDYVGTYGIAFNQTSNWGTHGYVTGDWATYFTMSNTENRGWIFRAGSNRFSIDGDGHAYANGLVNADRFNSRVATGTQPYACVSTTCNTNLNADMADGLHVHGGRNNEANKIVRTDGNGYVQTGYINTNVGTEDTLSCSRLFFEYNNDGYIRKLTPERFRALITDSVYLPRLRMRNPSNGTSAQGGIPFPISLKGAGYPVYTDPEFASGNNSVSVYNNSGNGTVTISRIADNQGSANSSGYILQISTTSGTASPGRGGFYQNISSRKDAVFAQIFRAKIPTGFSVVNAENHMGDGYTTHWLTDTAGTGKWEWYVRVTICGTGGTFSSGGHVYLSGSGAVTWYLAYCNLIDLTQGNYDGLRTRYSDYATSAGNADTVDSLHASAFMRATSDGSFYGIQHPGGGTSDWTRTTSNGIIPYKSGGASNLGTSSWPFSTVYANNFYGYLNGNISGSSASVRDVGNGTAITFSYSTGGFTSNPTWLAAWNGYKVTYVSPSVVSVGNADTVDGLHSNRFTFVYNSANYNASSSLTLNQMAADGNSNSHVGMIHAGTDNPVSTSGNWVHVWSQSWTRGSTASWCSQIALGVQQGTGMWYRTTSGSLAGRGWYRVIDSGNIGSQSVNYANSAGSSSSVSINYNNNANSTYQMLWGSGNYVYGTSGIYCNPYYDILYAEHHHGISHASSWLDGQRYDNAAFLVSNATDTGSYWPWIRQTNTGASKWYSIGVLSNSLYFIGSTTSRTDNGYDYGFRMDFSNGYLYGNFSGYLSGTAANATTATQLSSNAGSATNPIYFTGGKPAACTYSLSATVNSGTSGNLAYYSGANAISSYSTSLGSEGNPVYLSGGRLSLAAVGVIWCGYVYRSSYSTTTWYASYSFDSTMTTSSAQTTWVQASVSTNSSTGLMTITLSSYSGRASVAAYAAFATTRTIYNGSTYYPNTGNITGRSAGMGDYWIYCTGATIYIKKLKQQNGNNDKWADTDLITTTTSDGNKPVLSFHLLIFGRFA